MNSGIHPCLRQELSELGLKHILNKGLPIWDCPTGNLMGEVSMQDLLGPIPQNFPANCGILWLT